MAERQLNECAIPFPFDSSLNLDQPQPICPDPCREPNQQDVKFQTSVDDKYNLGKHWQCDPMQSGAIVNDMAPDPNRKHIHRYPKGIRGANEAMVDLFSTLVVLDDKGTAHKVPIIWGTQERAVMFALGENVRQDTSLVVDRLQLPMLAIVFQDVSMNMDRYTYHQAQNFFVGKTGKPLFTADELRPKDTVFGYARGIPLDITYQVTAWTYFLEDMCQIIEQVALKFSPIAYIRTQGNQWVSAVKLNSIGNNIDLEPGNSQNRVIKFQFNLTVEHYIPQPITRYKPVKEVRVDLANSVTEEEITDVMRRLVIQARSESK